MTAEESNYVQPMTASAALTERGYSLWPLGARLSVQSQRSRQSQQRAAADAVEPERARSLQRAHRLRSKRGVSEHHKKIDRREDDRQREKLRRLRHRGRDELRQEGREEQIAFRIGHRNEEALQKDRRRRARPAFARC